MHTHPPIQSVRPSRSEIRPPARTPLRVTSAGLSDAGRRRSQNEDRFMIATLGEPPKSAHLFAVADGVGGANGGDVASTMTMVTLDEALPGLRTLSARDAGSEEVTSALRRIFRVADRRLRDEGARQPKLNGMATTLTAAWVLGRRLTVASVGDSRCYLARNDSIHSLTTDQTVPYELMRLGLVPAAEIEHHPFRNVLTDFVGGGDAKLRVQIMELELRDGDIVLLCSDGLSDMVSDENLRRVLLGNVDPARACERLVMAANDRGGRDNVTAVVARVSSASEPKAS